jgi:hypothetical protein
MSELQKVPLWTRLSGRFFSGRPRPSGTPVQPTVAPPKEPEVRSDDLPYIQQIMEVVEEHEKKFPFSWLKVVDAEKFIVRTSTCRGRHSMVGYEVHDLRTYEGQISFAGVCNEHLLQSLFFLADVDPERRAPGYASTEKDVFVRSDLEPAMTLVGIMRKWYGIF